MQPAILHSVSYSGSWGQDFLSVESFIEKAAELGFDGVMLMAKRPHLSVLDWPPAARSKLRSRIERHGLQSTCVAGYTNLTADLEHGDIPTREPHIRHVLDLAEMARDLGGNLVRLFTGYEKPCSTYAAQSALVVQSLNKFRAGPSKGEEPT
jgi:L-ribulose-5-phosphate 3-epimerase